MSNFSEHETYQSSNTIESRPGGNNPWLLYPIIGNNNPENVRGTDIDIPIIILTAIIFYAVFSWYNFFLALYNYMIGKNSDQNREDVESCKKGTKTPENQNEVGYTFGIAVIWTIIAIVIYIIFRNQRMLTYPILNKARNYFSEKRKT